jgi:hypothetical protein
VGLGIASGGKQRTTRLRTDDPIYQQAVLFLIVDYKLTSLGPEKARTLLAESFLNFCHALALASVCKKRLLCKNRGRSQS